MSFKGTASRNPVTRSIIVKKYLWPSYAGLERGLSRSLVTSKNFSVVCVSFNGAGRALLLAENHL